MIKCPGLSFKYTCFYITDINQNIFKSIIPIDIVNYFIKIIEKTFLSLPSFINKEKKEQENQVSNRYNLKEIEKKSVAFIVHKGLIYGDLTKKGRVLFEKSLYYSDDKNSCLIAILYEVKNTFGEQHTYIFKIH